MGSGEVIRAMSLLNWCKSRSDRVRFWEVAGVLVLPVVESKPRGKRVQVLVMLSRMALGKVLESSDWYGLI